MNIKKYIQYLVFVVFLFSSAFFVLKIGEKIFKNTYFTSNLVYRLDYLNYYTGSSILKNGEGENLYNIDLQKRVMEEITPFDGFPTLLFRSFPVVALLYLPFVYLPYHASYIVFFFLSVFCVYILFHILKKFTLADSYLTIPVFFFFPLANSIFQGHPNLIFLFIIFFVYLFIKKEQPLLAGISSALIILRVQFIILVPFLFLMVKNKKKYLIGFVSSSLIFFLVSAFIVKGVQGLFQYPRFLLLTETSEFGSMPELYAGLPSFLSRFGIVDNFSSYQVFAWNIILYTIAFLGFWFLQGPKNKDAAFMSAILLSIVFSYHNYGHDLIILVLPIMFFITSTKTFYQKYKKISFDLVFAAFVLFFLPLLGIFDINFLSAPILIVISFYLLYIQKRKKPAWWKVVK